MWESYNKSNFKTPDKVIIRIKKGDFYAEKYESRAETAAL